VCCSADPAAPGQSRRRFDRSFGRSSPAEFPSIVRLSDYLAPQYRPWELGAKLFSAFGILALVVAVIGIYSTTSYGVQQRVHEFGYASRSGPGGGCRTARVGEGTRIVAIGVVVGIALAVAAGRFVAALLYA
jgi:hypothetical protein